MGSVAESRGTEGVPVAGRVEAMVGVRAAAVEAVARAVAAAVVDAMA